MGEQGWGEELVELGLLRDRVRVLERDREVMGATIDRMEAELHATGLELLKAEEKVARLEEKP